MQYIIILNDDGSRHTSLVVGVHGDTVNEVKAVAEKDYPDKQYLEGDSSLQNELSQPRSRWDGAKVVVDQVPEPTAEEIQANKAQALNAEYQPRIAALDEQIIRAVTIDNDSEYADELRSERDTLINEYSQKRGEL